MVDQPATAALKAALQHKRRHAGALAVVALAFGIAAVIGAKEAYYGAVLVTFTVWMVWFVLTAVDWVRLAQF